MDDFDNEKYNNNRQYEDDDSIVDDVLDVEDKTRRFGNKLKARNSKTSSEEDGGASFRKV